MSLNELTIVSSLKQTLGEVNVRIVNVEELISFRTKDAGYKYLLTREFKFKFDKSLINIRSKLGT